MNIASSQNKNCKALNKLKIIIVCKSFYPVITPRAFRASELSKELAKNGHEVTVCFPTAGYDYSKFEEENKLKIENLGKLKWINISPKGNLLQLFFRRIVKRGLQLLFEYPDSELFFLVTRYIKKTQQYDLLISIAVPYPIHWGVAYARNKNRKIARAGCR